MFNIPLSVPSLRGNEWQYVKECLDTEWVSSAGKYVDLFESMISEYTGAKYAIACVNGTSAIQLSLKLAGVQPGDEVIVPTLTFIAPVNAIAYNGAHPVFMDADNYYNINSEKSIEFIRTQTVFRNGFTYNKNTMCRISAFLPVHVWGNAVWQDDLYDICEERNISIVEDASESLGTFYSSGKFEKKHTGTIGKLCCISFNGNKIITTGGGGMILTNDQELAEKARYLSTQAKDDPLRYIHDEIGYNFRLTNVQAALGVAQMEQLPGFLTCRRKNYEQYHEAFKDVMGLNLAKVPSYAINNNWLSVLQIKQSATRLNTTMLMSRLKNNGIETRPVWGLNHLQKPFRKYQSFRIELAVDLIKNSLCLPSSATLTSDDIKEIVALINE